MGLSGTNALSERHAVWSKGHIIPDADPAIWRKDDYGDVIRYSDYGDRSSPFGWEKDHIVESALGGSDDLYNLRPLHYRTNASHGGLLAALLKR